MTVVMNVRNETAHTASAAIGRGATTQSKSAQHAFDQRGDQVGVAHAGRLPCLGIHGNRGEARHGVDFVDHHFAIGRHEGVDAAQAGAIDEKKITFETMVCFKRAGADGILTYCALDVARWIREGYNY